MLLVLNEPSVPNHGRCVLIAASCTTGWLDWVHGELWLCPDGLVRRSFGLARTVAHAFQRGGLTTVDVANRPGRSFTFTEIAAIRDGGRRNHWIPWDQIARATLSEGMTTNSLGVELRDGRTVKLLWLPNDGGLDILGATLPQVLGSRFVAPSGGS